MTVKSPDRSSTLAPDELARHWLAIGALEPRGRLFFTGLLIFLTILWGTFARGGFFRADLIVLVTLAVGAAAVALSVGRRTITLAWWLWTSAIPITAVGISAIANDAVLDIGYASAPIVAAISLGIAGSIMARNGLGLVALRIVVDVLATVAVLCWLGVALHLTAFAQPLNDGWRASGTIGYANVAGLLLLMGLLCGCFLAARSHHVGDLARCWVLATGLLTTQSRGAAMASLVCLGLLVLANRPMAKILILSFGSGLVTFIGLIPAIRGAEANALFAVVAVIAALLLMLLVQRYFARTATSRRLVTLAVIAALAAGGLLRSRLFDTGSIGGRIEIWREAITESAHSGLFGVGPHELARLSSGDLIRLFHHSDLLQYLTYYGWPGLIAFIVITGRLGWRLVRTLPGTTRDVWATGAATLTAAFVIALIDFPLQVPIVPAIASLILGATINLGRSPRQRRRISAPSNGSAMKGNSMNRELLSRSRQYWSRRPRPRIRPTHIAISGLVAATLFASTLTASGESLQAFSTTTRYVALGDSYSSGEGAPAPGFLPGTDVPGGNRCHRSPKAYSRNLVGTSGFPADLTFAACSGAKIANFYPGQGQYREPGQLQQLGTDTGLVSLTVGGNDVGFGPALIYCVVVVACQRQASAPMVGLIFWTRPRLEDLYRRILTDAPNAHVYVLGYPHFFPPRPGFLCNGIDMSEAHWMTAMEDLLNTVIRQAIGRVRSARLHYVDTASAFAGGELCNRGQAYMNGIIWDHKEYSFHPTVAGQQKLADVLARSVRSNQSAASSAATSTDLATNPS